MMDNCVSISGDLHLAKTLDALKLKEEGERKLFGENQDLKAELHQVKNTSQLLLEENKQLKSTQQQLCVKMDVLKNTVDGLKRENLELKDKVSQRHQQQSVLGASRGGSGGGSSDRTDGRCHRCVETDKELSKLKSANNEVCVCVCVCVCMHVCVCVHIYMWIKYNNGSHACAHVQCIHVIVCVLKINKTPVQLGLEPRCFKF